MTLTQQTCKKTPCTLEDLANAWKGVIPEVKIEIDIILLN